MEDLRADKARRLIEDSLLRVQNWIEGQAYRGYEPFDGLDSFLRPMTLGNRLADRLLLQLVRQAPINLRPILGVQPKESTKGQAYMARGYLTLLRLRGEKVYGSKATSCLQWLRDNRSPGYSDYCWGNDYDFVTRVVSIPRLEPIIPWSSLIGHAFVDGYELLHTAEYLDIARSVCRWIMSLPRTETDYDICLGYTPKYRTTVHAASMLGASLLARVGGLTRDDSFLKVAGRAFEYSCSRQHADGSWYYAEEEDCRWIDSFHTGYNIDSLKCYMDATGDAKYEPNFRSGLRYFKRSFFEQNGRPKYYHDRAFPVDIQCASQAIDTLSYCADMDLECVQLATRVAEWTITNMQDSAGYFYYRRLPYLTVKTPMLHWGQATMYSALSRLLARMPT